MATIITDDQNYINIADKLREKNGTQNSYKPSEMPTGIDSVYEAGKQAEQDIFWDMYQNYGKRGNWGYAFYNEGWKNETFKPKYDFICKYVCTGMFARSRVINIKKNITFIPATAGNKSTQVFLNAQYLETISRLIIDNSFADVTYASWFNGCTALKNITIDGEIKSDFDIHWSKSLTKASISSIVNALSFTEDITGKTLTLSEVAVNTVFETSVGALDGSTSDEWVALITPKSNEYDGTWTISLMDEA